MRTEIDFAVNFFSNMIRNKNVDPDQLTKFRESLAEQFVARFTNHWFPERPLRGNAYRCIRIVHNRMDKLVSTAAAEAGLNDALLLSAFPAELSVWIDPFEVSYRIGEEGSIGVLYPARESQEGSRNSTPSPISLPGSPVVVNGRKFQSGSSNQSSRNVSRNSTPSPLSVSSLPSTPMSHGSGYTQAYIPYLSMQQRVSPNTVNEAYMLQTAYVR